MEKCLRLKFATLTGNIFLPKLPGKISGYKKPWCTVALLADGMAVLQEEAQVLTLLARQAQRTVAEGLPGPPRV